jgi:hypothetical protein
MTRNKRAVINTAATNANMRIVLISVSSNWNLVLTNLRRAQNVRISRWDAGISVEMSPTLRLRAIERSFAALRRNRLERPGLDRRSGAPKVHILSE